MKPIALVTVRSLLLLGVLAAFPLIPFATAAEPLPPEFEGIDEVVFATRPFAADFHWYANFGYYACDEDRKTYSIGGQLCTLNLRTGKVTVLLDDPEGGVRGPVYTHSYFTLTARGQIADGQNRAVSNLPPRALGTSASKLMSKIDGSHHEVRLSEHEVNLIRYWLEAAATYPGTYAALGSGMLGHNMNETGGLEEQQVTIDQEWPSSKAAAAAIAQRCSPCHNDEGRSLPRFLSDNRGPGKFSRHLVFNLSRPEESVLLLAPLASEAGGWGTCRMLDENGKPAEPAGVFASTRDPEYQAILAMLLEGKDYIERITRFDMQEFRPLPSYVREMKRFGILDDSVQPGDVIDAHATDLAYWESLWWRPQS